MVKSVKFHVISDVVSYKSGLMYKILRGINTFSYGVFVSSHGGWISRPKNLEDHPDHHEEIQIRHTKKC
jgi:hypothetical protein